MSNFTETSNFDASVHEYALTDPVQGGDGGVANQPIQALVNRTRWLYDQLATVLVDLSLLAPINSPSLTGSPAAPTPAAGDASTLLATMQALDRAVASLVTVNVAGGANVVLTQAQAAAPILLFTGVLTANINVIFPNKSGRWLAVNATTGAFTLTCKTAAGAGRAISQGRTRGIFGDGTAIRPIDDLDGAYVSGAATADAPGAGDNSSRIPTTSWVQAALAAFAPLNSAMLTGSPTSTTPPTGDSSTRIATTAYVVAKLASAGAAGDMFRANNLSDVANPALALGNLGGLSATLAAATYAPLASPSFSGSPTAPTPTAGDNSGKLATTSYVTGAVAGLLSAQTAALTYAPLNSPALLGAPTAPTPSGGDNSQRLATTAFTVSLVATRAAIDSPSFTGTPSAPTPGAGDNSGRLATTAYVQGVAGTLAPRVNAVLTGGPTASTPVTGDISDRIATTAFVSNTLVSYLTTAVASATYAPINSPSFTGTPRAPNPDAGDNSTQVATTAWIRAAAASLKAQNGYVNIFGIILQWGYVGGPFVEGVVNASFPIAFPNTCFLADSTISNPSADGYVDYWTQTVSTSRTGATFYMDKNTGSSNNIPGIFFFAIGS